MQDKYGRPLSDDGRWFWDGSNWQPTGDGGASGAGGQAGGAPGLEPTMVAPVDYQPTGGQPSQPYGQQAGYPYPTGAPQGPHGPGQGGRYGPGRPPGGGPPTPFYKKPWVIIGALLVVSGVVVVVILLARGGGNSNSAGPGPSMGPTVIPTAVPSSEQPTAEPTSEESTGEPTQPANDEITPGEYQCTSGGSVIGTVDFTGTDYTTDTGAAGTYVYDESAGDISFTGGDLGPYSGTYDPNGSSMDLTTSSGGQLHCAR